MCSSRNEAVDKQPEAMEETAVVLC